LNGEFTDENPGRAAILPLLNEFPCMANKAGKFRYDVINGDDVGIDHIFFREAGRSYYSGV